MSDLLRKSTRSADGSIHVVVETPRGSKVKFKFDPGDGTFGVSRPLTLGLHYPFDWGFVPSTLAEDGDPLDALVIHDGESFPGVVIRCRPIAVLKVEQTERGTTRHNHRVMFVPSSGRRQQNLDDVGSLSPEMREQLERFFVAAVAGTGKALNFLGWSGRKEALEIIERSQEAFVKADKG